MVARSPRQFISRRAHPLPGLIATVTLNPSLDEWIQLRALRVGTLNRARNFEGSRRDVLN